MQKAGPAYFSPENVLACEVRFVQELVLLFCVRLVFEPVKVHLQPGQLLSTNNKKFHSLFQIASRKFSVADPGSGAFLTPGFGIGKKSRSGSWMNIPDHISESLEIVFWVKND
jgi:hypothetical protein